MEVQSQILLYLDKQLILPDMKIHCENFVSNLTLDMINKFPPFRYYLEIDVMKLLNILPELGKSLLTEPLQWQRFCNMILFACLRSLEVNIADYIQMNQIAVVIRLKNMSPHMIESGKGIYHSLLSVKGKLVDVSSPFPYVYHTVWSCPEECEGSELILYGIPKVLTKCATCRSNLYENSGLRRCGEQITVTFKVKGEIMPKKFKVADDLFTKVKLGLKYNVTAVVLKKNTEVWSMEVVEPLPVPITAVTPYDIKEMLDACSGIPWKFIYCLASTIGVNICPMYCFMHLKISLLLSLTSVKANVFTKSSIIHVLAAGNDTTFIGAIMRKGAKLTQTSMSLGTSNTSVSSALLTCTGGICYMPQPLDTYPQKITTAILSSMESGEIVHDTGRIKLGCAIWAQGMDFKKTIVSNFASVFNTVCREDYGMYEDDIAEFLLSRAINPCNDDKEPRHEMIDVVQYIDLVAGINVKLDEASEKQLRKYFLAARKERPRGVVIGSLKSLLNICMNSARLCRRSVTTEEDAIFAIWLHVSATSAPRFAPEEYLQIPGDIKQLPKIFTHFKKWLIEFTSSYDY